MPFQTILTHPNWCLSCGRPHQLLLGEVWYPLTCAGCQSTGQSCAPLAHHALCLDCWAASPQHRDDTSA
jgi:hypothetical protein